MPIKADNRKRYPADWSAIRARILLRSDNRCERCGVPNHAVGYRDDDGRFVPLAGNGPCDAAGQGLTWPGFKPLSYADAAEFVEQYNCCVGRSGRAQDDEGRRWIVIVLTIGHVHDMRPEACDDANLAAWCQRCHNRHDVAHRRANASATREAVRLAAELATGQLQFPAPREATRG